MGRQYSYGDILADKYEYTHTDREMAKKLAAGLEIYVKEVGRIIILSGEKEKKIKKDTKKVMKLIKLLEKGKLNKCYSKKAYLFYMQYSDPEYFR